MILPESLRLLFGRGWRSALLAVLLLCLTGCQECHYRDGYLNGRLVWWVVFKDDETGEVIDIHGPFDHGTPVILNPFERLRDADIGSPGAYDSNFNLSLGLNAPLKARLATGEDPLANMMFAFSREGKFYQYDPDNGGRTVRSVNLDENFRAVAVSPDNKFAYLTTFGPRNSQGVQVPGVKVVDLASFTATTIPLPAGALPEGIAVTPDAKTILVTAAGLDFRVPDVRLYFIDVAKRSVTKTLALPGFNIRNVAVTADGGLAVVNTGSYVQVVDLLTQTLSHQINAIADEMELDPRGVLYLAEVRGPIDVPNPPPLSLGIGAYDLATGLQIKHFRVDDVGGTPDLALTPTGSHVALAFLKRDPQTGVNTFPVLKIFDTKTGAEVGEFTRPSNNTNAAVKVIGLP